MCCYGHRISIILTDVAGLATERPREEDEAWAAGSAAGGAAAAPPPLPPGKRDWQDYLVELTLQFRIT